MSTIFDKSNLLAFAAGALPVGGVSPATMAAALGLLQGQINAMTAAGVSGIKGPYGTTAGGIAGTSNGDYFLVISTSTGASNLYQNVSGTATLVMQWTRPVVGTVSQSGGLPTGAIIERGSNSNGNYTRWADGTQICTGTLTLTRNLDISCRGIWTHPASFLAGSNPTLTATPIFTTAVGYADTSVTRGYWGTIGTPNLMGAGSGLVDLYKGNSAPSIPEGATIMVAITAIGRWY
ncbi:hypothetical protein [Paenirhodobacter populi]|uniref:Phage tail protein n=1 Tax=Paenirhodobacter populi TaxID=2306993 RepID=A0A443JEA1_9RHOB|nr:hypothetical protein [Sinirhodobacter populi]RWR18790.1 hypothetical protein D2T30_15625 [Sinirhodobacter populi]